MKRAAALLAVLTACTAGTPTAPRPSVPRPSVSESSPAPSPSVSSPSAEPAVFDAARVEATIRELSSGIGNREDTSPGFRAAVSFVTDRFRSLGYVVSHQTIPIPAGDSVGTPVKAGTTINTIATPPGYDPSKPHLLVGGHLDTVAGTPGANDNASGVATVLELARLAAETPTAMPIVWVAWGGEERRKKGEEGALFGSRFYLSHLPKAERASLRGVLAVDVVANGPYVRVASGGVTPRGFIDALLAAARRIGVAADDEVITKYFSDHKPFEGAGFTVAWLYSGNHPAVHTARDTMSIVQQAEIDRIGRVAWETLRTLRL